MLLFFFPSSHWKVAEYRSFEASKSKWLPSEMVVQLLRCPLTSEDHSLHWLTGRNSPQGSMVDLSVWVSHIGQGKACRLPNMRELL